MARKALLVGIDIYPDPRNNLNSCVADTLAFRSLLISQYGFQAAEITLLHNSSATLANVRAALDDLVAGAESGDTLVFFDSSHGYRFPQGDTMVEVLCLYDGFLHDRELVDRAAALPPGVFTCVADACHAGGLNKLFFAADGAQLIRAKVWQPSAADADRHAGESSQVTKFKFFGREATGDSAAVAKNLVAAPEKLLQTKSSGAGSVLNGALFAACQADETAAAGSAATDNLSAFTYAIVREVTGPVQLRTLADRVTARLQTIGMRQTPRALTPAGPPQLLDRGFITLQPVGGGPITQPAPEEEFDPWEWLRGQLSGVL
jgi:hypothetical protein